MSGETWEKSKVHGRDEVLKDIERRAHAHAGRVVEDVLNVMRGYEVDLYRYILGVAERYGQQVAFEIQSDTVAKMRVKWVDQNWDALVHEGTDLDRGVDLFLKYFKLKDGNFEIVERTDDRVVIKRKEYVDMITYTCRVLELDVVDVSNEIYARATNIMFEKISPRLKYTVLDYADGWYREMIELT